MGTAEKSGKTAGIGGRHAPVSPSVPDAFDPHGDDYDAGNAGHWLIEIL